jgi:3-oxoacyl-[acyl-carrier protein] reductase
MNLNISGKVAFITGSSRGIGWAIAKALHTEGCRVILNGRNAFELASRKDELHGSVSVLGDVTEPAIARDLVLQAVNAFGCLDILVCNVGSGRSVAPGEESFEEWNRILTANFLSATNVIEASRAALVASKGSIVCISSICGLEVVPGAPVTYSVAKAALNAYVRGIARPFGRFGVRINAVAPGNIFFEGSVWDRRLKNDEPNVTSMLEREVALGRFGYPDEVANLVTYLVSPKSGFSTGSVWSIDGGQGRS